MTTGQHTRRPLDGVRVIEVGQLLAGPFAATILGYYAGLNAQTHPPIPAGAYAPGVAVSAASL